MITVTYQAAEAIDILRRAKQIAQRGGDSSPCSIGTFCIRCLCSLAKGEIDAETEVPCDLNDGALLRAVSRCRAVGDEGINHATADDAIAILDRAIEGITQNPT